MADEIEGLHRRLTEAEARAASAEARLMEHTGSEADVASSMPPAPLAPQVAAAPDALPATPADFDETLRRTLVLAQRTADETVKEAYDEAERVKNNAHGEADLVLSKARGEAEGLEADANRRQSALITEAEATSARMLEEARVDADQRRNDLETALNEAEGSERAELLEQIANLQVVRKQLTVDVEKLESHMESRRLRIESALAEIASVLEDPTRMHPEAAPDLADLELIDPDDYSAVALTAEGLEPDPVDDGEIDDSELDGSELDDSEIVAGGASDNGIDDGGTNDDERLDPDVDTAQADGEGQDVLAGETNQFNDDNLERLERSPVETDIDPFDATGPDPFAAGPPTEQFSFADLDSEQAASEQPWADSGQVPAILSGVEASRPAWAEAVPDDAAPVVQDPFLDELRRATSEDSLGSDEAIDRFLDGDEEDEDRKTWFGRRK